MGGMPESALNHQESGSQIPPLDVAIVGGGIVGLVAALGFLHRGMNAAIYERAAKLQEVGAGIAFTGVARQCLKRLNPNLLEALRKVGQPSPRETVRYWDGFHPQAKEQAQEEATSLLFDVPQGDLDFWACLRSHFLAGMIEQIPDGIVHLGKELVEYTDGDGSEKVILRFVDGSTAEADVVIGCDGIHSATRRLLLGGDHPAADAAFTHKTMFRSLVPVPGAIDALGADKAGDSCIHLGPDAHIISFPINNGAMYNIFIAIHTPQEWPDRYTMTSMGTRDEVASALKNWGPHITELVQLMPETLSKYGVFDMADNPVPTYACGRVGIAGDAAHAASPFHGAGAGMGVEDALALAHLLEKVQSLPPSARSTSIAAALQAYSSVRMERSQWLVQSSRDMGDIYQWRYPGTGRESSKCKAEFVKRAKKLWDFDVDAMVVECSKEFETRVAKTG